MSLIAIVAILTSQWYSPFSLPDSGTIEMPPYFIDATPVTVHYGMRARDFFWTDTTVGKLKDNRDVVLNIDGQNIFSIQVVGRQVYVNASLFAGYNDEIVPKYTDIGSTSDFSMIINGYLDMTILGSKFFEKFKPTVAKYKALSAPVELNIGNSIGFRWLGDTAR